MRQPPNQLFLSKEETKLCGPVMAIIAAAMIGLAFWFAVGYAAFHFIEKFW